MRLIPAMGIFLIKFYQAAISPILGMGKCRFYPSCSEYAAEAIRRYGLFYGSQLALRRLFRCGPWSRGGYDPVPEQEEFHRRIWIGKFFGKNFTSSKG